MCVLKESLIIVFVLGKMLEIYFILIDIVLYSLSFVSILGKSGLIKVVE